MNKDPAVQYVVDRVLESLSMSLSCRAIAEGSVNPTTISEASHTHLSAIETLRSGSLRRLSDERKADETCNSAQMVVLIARAICEEFLACTDSADSWTLGHDPLA